MATGQCWQKSATTPIALNSAVISALHGPSVLASDQCTAVASGLDISPGSNDISNSYPNGLTIGQCCQSCNANSACKAFVWVQSTQICYLKSVSTPTVASTAGLVSGNRGGGAASACTLVNDGYDITPGMNDISNAPSTGLGDCCNQCNSNSACHGFVYVKSNMQCYLKSVSGPINNSNAGIISGGRG